MKNTAFLACFLILVACQFKPLPEGISQPSTAVVRSTRGAPPSKFRARLNSNGQYEQFQLMDLGEPTQSETAPAYFTLTLTGEGINTQYSSHFSTAAPPISLSNIPVSPGALRLVRIQGYDSSDQPLSAYEAWGYYRSQQHVQTVEVNLGRNFTLAGRVLSQALTDQPRLLTRLDLAALQTVLTETMNYNAVTDEFERDPSFFDVHKILSLIPPAGSPLPTATALQQNALLIRQELLLTLLTPNGLPTDEPLYLVLKSSPAHNPRLQPRSPGESQINFPGIPPGRWGLEVRGLDGRPLKQTILEANPNGGSHKSSLVLSGISEYNPEFQLNPQTLTDQKHPALANLKGSLIVAWESDDGSGTGIYARYYDVDGQPIDADFLVNTQTSGDQSQAQVTRSESGQSVIVWKSNDGSGTGLYGRRYDALRQPIGEPFQITQSSQVADSRPAIASNNLGYFVVVWESDNGSGSDIYAQYYGYFGFPVGSEFQVNSQSAGSHRHPAIAMHPNGFIIVWESDDGSGPGIYARLYDNNNLPTGPEFRVNTETNGAQQTPTIGADSSGNFVISWVSADGSGTGIYAQRYDSAGLPLGAEISVNSWTSDAQSQPALTMDSTGHFVISWTSAREGSAADAPGIYAQRYDASGQPRGSEFRINGSTRGSQSSPTITSESNGNFVVSWQNELDGAGTKIYAARYDGAGLAR